MWGPYHNYLSTQRNEKCLTISKRACTPRYCHPPPPKKHHRDTSLSTPSHPLSTPSRRKSQIPTTIGKNQSSTKNLHQNPHRPHNRTRTNHPSRNPRIHDPFTHRPSPRPIHRRLSDRRRASIRSRHGCMYGYGRAHRAQVRGSFGREGGVGGEGYGLEVRRLRRGGW